MPYRSIDPATGETHATVPDWERNALLEALADVAAAQRLWAERPVAARAEPLRVLAGLLRARAGDLADLMAREMGKPVREGRAEVEKCALACEYYALYAPPFLQDEVVETDAGRSYVAYEPLGVLLAVMPWNFPLWQVVRAAAPALVAGNGVALKHASNVPAVAGALEALFRDAGFPAGLMRTLYIAAVRVEEAVASPLVHAVTLTGSEQAGRQVAAAAGRHLKKCVLELGGSDPFVVLADADVELAAAQAVAARFQNAGQSCIAAKRLILVPEVAETFLARFVEHAKALVVGDPRREKTQVGPLARRDLRDALHAQVEDALAHGAEARLGCAVPEGPGAFYPPSVLDRVTPAARVYHEEVFGPVALVLRAVDEADALRLANDTPFGLGASVWSRDTARAEAFGRRIQSGACFINGMVKSDPRLPFGGVKASGFGRELSYHGLREFVNARTVWIR